MATQVSEEEKSDTEVSSPSKHLMRRAGSRPPWIIAKRFCWLFLPWAAIHLSSQRIDLWHTGPCLIKQKQLLPYHSTVRPCKHTDTGVLVMPDKALQLFFLMGSNIQATQEGMLPWIWVLVLGDLQSEKYKVSFLYSKFGQATSGPALVVRQQSYEP